VGESSYSTLERAARQFGVLIGTSAKGELVLGSQSVGEAAIALVTGPEGNVASWSSSTSHAERFGRTEVLGQNDGGFAPLLGQESPRAVAFDPEIRPQRQRQFIAQGQVQAADCERLATWHTNMARALSSSLRVTLPSWRQGSAGELWRPGLEVPVTITEVGEEGVLLTDRVELRFTESGAEEASLSLIRKDSLLRDPSEGVVNEGVGLAGLI
jgi:prophage tail gpP-like protein